MAPRWKNANDPAMQVEAIVPHVSTNMPHPSRYIYVGGAGDITLIPVGGTAAVVFKAVPVGTVLPVQASRVNAIGTSATYLLSLY